MASLRLFIVKLGGTDTLDIFPPDVCTEAPNMKGFALIQEGSMNETQISRTIHAPRLHSLILLESKHILRSFTATSLPALCWLAVTLATFPSSSYL